ncbi:hypothetical protein CFOL_v3_25283 [Cephalotus follicularis]|uniref:Exo_endo_phos domain-containing protein n=1 Tax=Cephalotus follicularis TaxID=3775 RepID=A0A1Q3CNK2_CEPFO|nr:hypothetical protein CFOL_v3_25283 [Cephalotus follicularis]
MEDFHNAIRAAELEDLKSTWLSFTWTNMRSGTATISKKLDRAMGGDSYAHSHNPGILDHSPISIQLMQHPQSSGRPFKFMNLWVDHADFLSIVTREWGKVYDGAPLKVIHMRLKALKGRFRSLYARPDTMVEDLRQRLKMVQTDLDDKPKKGHLKKVG